MDSIVQIKLGKKMYEGQVTYQEGDVVEVVFSEPLTAQVGDPVSCLITHNYSEIQNFNGVILAKDDKRIILFYSPTATEFREQRRRYPRFDVNFDAVLERKQEDGSTNKLIVKVTNVSLGGLALHTSEKLASKTEYRISVQLPDARVDLAVMNIYTREENGFHYGCKVTSISSKNLHVLRRYILNRQLEMLKLQHS
ncbi:PilZ domain-containing protein [Brevibacillus fluminis]|uniref:PilZ domain-containing protein n=1 Tax=Brevibacillus fluminis TaxID=511487 RepID=A0A3M8DW00_9BACL|nr:PilZ domain-containing protein [Brevibacillus fluminis]RNB92350.1 PilZ domain-containing protein [Brevibacillus fluminis]